MDFWKLKSIRADDRNKWPLERNTLFGVFERLHASEGCVPSHFNKRREKRRNLFNERRSKESSQKPNMGDSDTTWETLEVLNREIQVWKKRRQKCFIEIFWNLWNPFGTLFFMDICVRSINLRFFWPDWRLVSQSRGYCSLNQKWFFTGKTIKTFDEKSCFSFPFDKIGESKKNWRP